MIGIVLVLIFVAIWFAFTNFPLFAQSFFLARKAFQDDPAATNRLGMNRAKAIDWDKAFRCFEFASQQGDLLARYNLAFCYEYGLGTSRYLKRALELYTELAENDDDAVLHLGNTYLLLGSSELALKTYARAAERSPKCKLAISFVLRREGGDETRAQWKRLRKEARKMKYVRPKYKLTGDRDGVVINRNILTGFYLVLITTKRVFIKEYFDD